MLAASTKESMETAAGEHGKLNVTRGQASMIRVEENQETHPVIFAADRGLAALKRPIVWFAIFVVLAATSRITLMNRPGGESLDMMTAALLVGAYVVIASASDVLVKWETQVNAGTMPFAPGRMVFVVEFLKFMLTVAVVVGRVIYYDMKWPSQEDSLAAMRLMIVPAISYSMNNAIIYIVVARLDFASLSVWRQLTPLFVASIWVAMFGRQLGIQRWFALALLVSGTALNSVGQTMGVRLNNTMILVVLCSCLTTAVAGVANEYVLKRCGRLDIDFLCCLLYVQTSVISLLLAVACESRTVMQLAGVSPSLQGNTLLGGPSLSQEPGLIVIIALQVIFGFAVARVIRYLGAVPRAIVNAAKELTVIVIAPVFTDSHMNGVVLISAMIVGAAAALFTLAPSPLPPSKALKKGWSPGSALPGIQAS